MARSLVASLIAFLCSCGSSAPLPAGPDAAPAGRDAAIPCGAVRCGRSCCAANQVCNPDGEGCCVPNCNMRSCGDDGCGAVCGFCQPGTRCNQGSGQCVACTPQCAGRKCGSDQCGGSCGQCQSKQTCTATGTCCTPSCAGKECGDDGCGGSCGPCLDGTCDFSGHCQSGAGPDAGFGDAGWPDSSGAPPDAGAKTDSGAQPDAGAHTDAGIGGVADFCVQVLEAWVDWHGRCGGEDPQVSLPYSDAPWRCDRVAEEASAGRIAFDPSKKQACLDYWSQRACDTPDPDPDPCYAALRGRVAPGDDCWEDFDCEPQAACDTTTSCPSTCVARSALGGPCSANPCVPNVVCASDICTSPATSGHSCGGTNPTCGPGLVCVGESSGSGTCMAGPGNPCLSISDCLSRERCDLSGGSPGTCLPRKKAGTGCVPTADYDVQCDLGDYCDPGTYECKPWGGVGASCGLFGGELALCVDASCPDLVNGSTCAPQLEAGETCSTEIVNPCAHGTCNGGVCVSKCKAF
jgi:hypothetical protein